MSTAVEPQGGLTHGRIEITPIPAEFRPKSSAAALIRSRQLYRWHPPCHLIDQLPSWYSLTLQCIERKDGIRQFFPVTPAIVEGMNLGEGAQHVTTPGGLVLVASLGGAAILTERGESEAGRLGYHEMRLLNAYIRHRREYFGKTTRLEKVLRVCGGARVDSSARNILPEDLGRSADGRGQPWNIKRLMYEGREAAREAGIANPMPEQILRFGLLAAPRDRYLNMDVSETAFLVRMALFALGPSADRVPDDGLEYVADQVRQSLLDHRQDTKEKFRRWVEDADTNLVRRIEKRKDCKLKRPQVRNAILELGWRSFRSLGRCVGSQMYAFQQALPEPLSDDEELLFRWAYLGGPELGGFPLAVLHDRLPFLKEAVLTVWNQSGDPLALAGIRAMLYYYWELASNRRAADRTIKQQAQAQREHGRPLIVSLLEDSADHHEDEEEEENWLG